MVDRYMKAVLTVIAAALSVLAAQGFVNRTVAQSSEPMKVQICDVRNNCANLASVSMSWGEVNAVVTMEAPRPN